MAPGESDERNMVDDEPSSWEEDEEFENNDNDINNKDENDLSWEFLR